MITIRDSQFGRVWSNLLSLLISDGVEVKPRGFTTREIRNVQIVVDDARANILVNDARKVNYRFMVAEWLWIWYGRDDVATIKKYNRAIAEFSDNGIDFNGAYGKAITPAWPYAMQSLLNDENTRQSVIVIFKQPEGKTKDVPCTISYQFLLREGKLHLTVNMRSSDIWLGLPYDMFNASMLLNIAAGQINADIGSVTFNLASSHLYERNLAHAIGAGRTSSSTVYSFKLGGPPPPELEKVLTDPLMEKKDRKELGILESPWDMYADVLMSLHPFHCFPLLGHLMPNAD